MSQFMEVVEWLDETGTEIVHRIPEEGSGELKLGAQLVVRDSQAAILFRDGKGLDVFGPGRHTLSTNNVPILTKVLSLPWGFTSPFRAEVVFVNLRVFTELRWGTQDPVVFRDRELGLIRLRAFGVYAMRITEPLAFVNTLVGTLGTFGTEQIQGYLRELIVSRLNDTLGECVDSLADLPSRYDTMAATVRDRLAEDFRRYGAELVDLRISRITPPDEVQRMIDGRSGMAAIGDLDGYLKLRAADALADAAAGGGGDAACADASTAAPGSGVGTGIALGAGLGLILPGMLLRTRGGAPLATDDMLARGVTRCPECHAEVSTQSRFCASCGHQMVVARRCMRCDKNVTAQANFCPSCGLDLRAEHRCARCSATLPPGTRFCFHCGEPTAELPRSAPPAEA